MRIYPVYLVLFIPFAVHQQHPTAMVLLFSAVSVPLAVLLNRFVERPAGRWVRRPPSGRKGFGLQEAQLP